VAIAAAGFFVEISMTGAFFAAMVVIFIAYELILGICDD